MNQNVDEDVVVVARVWLALPDGSEEAWLVPMRLTDDALSYHAAVYPPEGAVVVGVEPLKRSGSTRQDLVVARADVTLL